MKKTQRIAHLDFVFVVMRSHGEETCLLTARLLFGCVSFPKRYALFYLVWAYKRGEVDVETSRSGPLGTCICKSLLARKNLAKWYLESTVAKNCWHNLAKFPSIFLCGCDASTRRHPQLVEIWIFESLLWFNHIGVPNWNQRRLT